MVSENRLYCTKVDLTQFLIGQTVIIDKKWDFLDDEDQDVHRMRMLILDLYCPLVVNTERETNFRKEIINIAYTGDFFTPKIEVYVTKPFLKRQTSDLSKLKEFADDNF